MRIKKITLYAIGILVLLIVGGISLIGPTAVAEKTSGNGEIQTVKLSVSGGNYVLEPSEIKQGVKVRLEADIKDLPGCSRSVVIPSFGVSKTFTSKSNYVEFTPDKTGTFNIACSMNMYRGTFTVVGEGGEKGDYVEQELSASAGSCGATGGGCGCGGY